MNELTTTEQASLERYEKVIEKGLASFYEVGSALLTIRDSKLYRGTHGTFEAYCLDKWGMSRIHAYRLIDSCKVVDNVTDRLQNSPANIEQTRPLARLEPQQQKEAWQQAVATAPDGKVTAAHVYKIVKGMTMPEKKESKPEIKPLPKMPEHAVYFATCAISHLERICDTDPSKQEALDMVQNWIDKHR